MRLQAEFGAHPHHLALVPNAPKYNHPPFQIKSGFSALPVIPTG